MKIISFIILLCLVNLSCEKCTECPDLDKSTNHTPVISEILFDPSPPLTIHSNGTAFAGLTAVATDEDGDSLSYYWSASVGGFPWSSVIDNPTDWQTEDAGTHTIKVIVSDGKSLDSMSVNVVVN